MYFPNVKLLLSSHLTAILGSNKRLKHITIKQMSVYLICSGGVAASLPKGLKATKNK